MRLILSLLTSRGFLSGTAIALVIILILFLGRYFGVDLTLQLIAIIVVLMIGMVIMMVSVARANKNAAAIEQSIKQQSEQQLMGTRPDKRAEIERFQEELNRAIEMLKQSKLGQGRRGKAALYVLPWYMFIGPPAAGKTTAIANSGLNFPLGTGGIRGVGGTRNCDWFFSDSAILLDTAGRYMTEHEDTEEWMAFLETLRKNRPERPINGIIVGISMAELLDAEPDQIDWHAENIRRRIDELISNLGVSFPVYLLFTKCDLLQGFVEFFGELSRQEREEIWGATFDEEQQAAGDLRPVFEEEYQRLTDALLNLRAGRLTRSMKREDRQKVYVFPLEVASAKDRLARFVGRLFQPNPYQESPTFRGFYFTSGTQEGVPIDRVIQSIARQFDLPPDASADFSPETEAKSYFIKGVFTDVVIPDQYMVRQTSRAATQGRLFQAGVATAAVVLLGLFALGASQAVVRSKRDLNQAEVVVKEAAVVQWNNPAMVDEGLGRMILLREEIDDLEDPSLLRLGLDRNDAVLEPARNLYARKTRAFIEAVPMAELMQRLTQGSRKRNLSVGEQDSLFQDLKAYLLLTDEAGRVRQGEGAETYAKFITNYLYDLSLGHLDRARQLDALTNEQDQQIQAQVNRFAEGFVAGRQPAFEAGDARLVAQARSAIQQKPDQYVTLKQEGISELGQLEFEDIAGPDAAGLFRRTSGVPRFFTKEGYAYFRSKIETQEDPTGEDWVLGREATEAARTTQDREALARDLEARYFGEYAGTWKQFLRRIQYAPFGSLREAADRMADLSDPTRSPLSWILARVAAETQFVEPAPEGEEEGVVGQGLNRLRGQRGGAGHPVDQQFQGIHALNAVNITANPQAAPDLASAFKSLDYVASQLETISSNEAEAVTFVGGVLNSGGGDLNAELRSIDRSLRGLEENVREELFEQPIRMSWNAMMNAAQRQLDQLWREEVYEPYRSQLAGKYPFAGPDIQQDVQLRDFDAFFGAQEGALAQFIEQLEPFLNRGMEARTWEGRGLDVSAARAAQAQAQRLRNLYRNGTGFQFMLHPEQPPEGQGQGQINYYDLRIHGTSNRYGMGRSGYEWVEFGWPGNEPGASLEVETRQRAYNLPRFQGDWAWFRMLEAEAAQVRPSGSSSTEYEIRWQAAPGFVARYRLQARGVDIPFDNLRSFFSLRIPESLSQSP